MALTAPFWDLARPLTEVDDARYAEIPREMAASGDWLVPTLGGFPYVEKPPLGYWLPAISYRLLGVSEAAARLPLALLSLLGMAGVCWLAGWLYGRAEALWAVVVLGFSSLYFILSHQITPDLPLAVFLLWSSGLALRCMLRPEDAGWAAPLSWAAAALAVLSKGLVGIVFPAAWVVALALFRPEMRRGAGLLLRPLGPLLFLVIAAPWFLAVEKLRPGFLRVFFIEQHFQRFLTPRYNRPAPWFFYLVVGPAGLLPWLFPAAAGALLARRDWKEGRPATAALVLWPLLVTAFFSLSHSKLATYILPALPHAAILAARALASGEAPLWSRRASAWLGALLLAAALLVPLAWPSVSMREPPPAASVAWAAAGLAALGAALAYLGRGAALQAAGYAVAFTLFTAGAMRAGGPWLSARDVGTHVRSRLRPGDAVWAYGTYLHGLPFYTGKTVDLFVNWVGELEYAKRDPAFSKRFGTDDHVRELLPLEGRRTFVVFRTFEAPWLLRNSFTGELKSMRSFGRWSVAEY